MKKLTPTSRVIDIFSTESLESCAILLELAQGLVKQRQSRNAPKVAKRAAKEPDPDRVSLTEKVQ